MAQPRGINRRGFLAGVGATAALVADNTSQAHAEANRTAPRENPDQDTLDLRQGTHIAARLSPDGRTIALDLVGVLWTLPASGGTCRRLTSDLFDIAQPDWFPDGRSIVFQSYRDGIFNIWAITPDGTDPRQLTRGPYDHREPRVSPDGRRIAFSSDQSGSYAIHTYDLVTAATTQLTHTAAEEYEPTWSPDGTRIAFVVATTGIDIIDLTTGIRTSPVRLPNGNIIHSPTFTPDGDELLYTVTANGTSQLIRGTTPLVTGEDVFPFRVSWASPTEFLYTADGQIRRRSLTSGRPTTIGFAATVTTASPRYRKRQRDFDSAAPRPVRGIGSPTLSPDGQSIAFRALNDIYTMRIGGHPEPLTRDRWWKATPAWSPDGHLLSYSSDRAGKADIWIRDLHAGTDRQLTNLPGAAALSATWSPDGSHLAFLDQTGAVYTVETTTGVVRRVYAATFEPGRPTWSADGDTIAIAAIKPYSSRFREGLNKILLINRTTGAGTYLDPLPHRSIQTRGDDGPVWSPDGTTMAFVIGSVLWVMPVATDGTPTGPPRQLTHEVTDAPTWSGDSHTLLYLSNGHLRQIDRDSGVPHTIHCGLTWTNTQPRGRTVIHAGRMWDGSHNELHDNVDIVVEGHRISEIGPHRDDRDGTLVDASHDVVIPGLVDMHNHREMQGYAYGDRQGRLWLSLGITTTRSPGSPAYHMVEERESIQSGARVGPRYFATGEAIDGTRIFYNFMRPTVDEHQLALELERAAALDYDLMKAYVRLPIDWQRRVIDFAHLHGIHVTSHYHYPAIALGSDGMEHIGATNRFGYSRTVTALGNGYDDVTGLFATAKAGRAPTLFGSVTLFREDSSLVDDTRVTTLYPTWEYTSLKAAATTAQTTDQTVPRNNLANQVAQLVAMIRAGGVVLTGTDSPIDHTAVSTHMNLRAMVTYGLTPYQALLTATRAPGEFLGEPLGQISQGMYADLTFLGADPLTDITRAADVRQVMVNGALHTVEELLQPFSPHARTMTTTPTNTILPDLPNHPSNQSYWWHDPHYLADSKRSCCAGE